MEGKIGKRAESTPNLPEVPKSPEIKGESFKEIVFKKLMVEIDKDWGDLGKRSKEERKEREEIREGVYEKANGVREKLKSRGINRETLNDMMRTLEETNYRAFEAAELNQIANYITGLIREVDPVFRPFYQNLQTQLRNIATSKSFYQRAETIMEEIAYGGGLSLERASDEISLKGKLGEETKSRLKEEWEERSKDGWKQLQELRNEWEKELEEEKKKKNYLWTTSKRIVEGAEKKEVEKKD